MSYADFGVKNVSLFLFLTHTLEQEPKNILSAVNHAFWYQNGMRTGK